MLEKMKEMVADQLNVDAAEITAETSFKDDLGADSLDPVSYTHLYQERDEQCKMDLVCNWISVSACLLRISGDQSGWKRYLLWCIHSMADRCNCTDRIVHLAAGSSV